MLNLGIISSQIITPPYEYVGVYSMRKVISGYSGSCIRLRKDGASPGESDFGFSGDDLDISAISSWLGSDNAFVVTWYDQSERGNDFSQSTTSSQPYFNIDGFGSNNKPCISCNAYRLLTIVSNNTDFDLPNRFTFNFAINYDGNIDYLFTKNAAKNIELSFSSNSPRIRSEASVILLGSTVSPPVSLIYQISFDKDEATNQVKMFLNNSAAGTATKTNSFTVDTGTTYLLGNNNNLNNWTGYISECIIKNVAMNSTDLSDLAGDMNTYYGVY